MSVSEEQFRLQLDLLERIGVKLLTLADVNVALDTGRPPLNGALITLDDGYVNTIDTILPILEEFNAPALVSLCGSYINKSTRPAMTIHASQDFAGIAEIEAWLATGREIAGHSYDHPRLTELADHEVVAQVLGDRHILETCFGRRIDTFIYPFGAVNRRVEEIVGTFYRNAFADSSGHWPARTSRLAMRRMRIRPEWSPVDFRNRIEDALRECVSSILPTGGV